MEPRSTLPRLAPLTLLLLGPLAHAAPLGDELGPEQVEAAAREGLRRLERHHRLQASPPPPHPVRRPADFEPVDTLVVAWPDWGSQAEVTLELIRAVHGQVAVEVLVASEDRSRLRKLLAALDLDRVRLVGSVPYRSIWIRDYGPEPVFAGDELVLVDSRYCFDCYYDEVVPEQLGARWRLPVYRTSLWFDGGHLLSNGSGLCFATTDLAAANGMTPDEAAEFTRAWFGCERTAFLPSLTGNAVPHVDVFLAVADEDLVLLGEYREDQDPVNRELLEQSRAALEAIHLPDGRPLRVRRVPMPDLVVHPEGPLVRSHLNLVVANGVVVVPVYEHQGHDPSVVVGIVEDSFPGRSVVTVDAEALAVDAGSLHCITRTLPTAGRPAPGGER